MACFSVNDVSVSSSWIKGGQFGVLFYVGKKLAVQVSSRQQQIMH